MLAMLSLVHFCSFPGALVGGWLGAKLSGAIPVKAIRGVFALLVAWAAFKMFYSSASVLLF